jgi:molecular chaperone GrpE
MTDESQINETKAAQAAAEQEAPVAEQPAEAAAPSPTVALQAEIADLKDKLLRTLADMENLRRRTEKEVRDAREYAITGFARDLLSVGDNLARAVTAIPDEARTGGDETLKVLVEGVDLTSRELLKTLEKHGVKKLEPLNARFDPNVHQAMFELPNPEVPSGTVVQVLQDGYVIGDRVLRPALVGVAKGGPKVQATVDKIA